MERRAGEEEPSALRSVEFMGTNGNQVSVELVDVRKWLFAEPLHRVSVEKHAALAAKRAEFGNGLDCADLVVRRHDGNQNRVRPEGFLQIVRRDAAFRIYRQNGELEPLLFRQILAAMQHGMMFNRRRDNVPPLRLEQ